MEKYDDNDCPMLTDNTKQGHAVSSPDSEMLCKNWASRLVAGESVILPGIGRLIRTTDRYGLRTSQGYFESVEFEISPQLEQQINPDRSVVEECPDEQPRHTGPWYPLIDFAKGG